ncbi:MAG TPA: S-layer homology domain-containing protein, partial [Paenisporosarcina sp.]|nr:S-layer homology domain-containing protein [Paenisporosarcina sp.]
AIGENNLEIHKRIRIGNSMILTSQGTAFLHAGQEYGRTKQWLGEGVPEQKYHEFTDVDGNPFGYFVHDSYDSSDAINKFDWEKATNKIEFAVNATTRTFTQGLIDLRKSTNAFRLGEKALVDTNVSLLDLPEMQDSDLVIAYENVSTDKTGNYYVFVNADNKARTLTLGEYNFSDGVILVDNDEAGTKKVSKESGFTLSKDALTIEPLTTIVIKLDRKATEEPKDNGNGGSQPSHPTPPPAPGKPHTIQLPAHAAEVVKEKNPSGMIEVITKIVPGKVKEIVDAMTTEKFIIPVKLEKPAAGEMVKAQVPGSLFIEALKKTKRAMIEIQTDEASYKLPASEIDISDLAKQLGVAESDVQITISVNVVKSPSTKAKVVSDVVEFHLEAVAGDKKVTITDFGSFVEREIVGKNEFDPKISVAVKFNQDGTFTSLPTLFNGNVATVKSLTNSTYAIVEQNKTFPDVDNKNWAEESIEKLASKYIIAGKANGTYAPAEDITRAEFTVLLVRALGLPAKEYDNSFSDVKGSEWFNTNGELMAAVQYGLVVGKDDGTFAPYEKLTRTQAAVMIARAMELKFLNFDPANLDSAQKLTEFKDANKFSNRSKLGIEAVYQAGIMAGKKNGTFDPYGYTKRDQMAKILAAFLEKSKLID